MVSLGILQKEAARARRARSSLKRGWMVDVAGGWTKSIAIRFAAITLSIVSSLLTQQTQTTLLALHALEACSDSFIPLVALTSSVCNQLYTSGEFVETTRKISCCHHYTTCYDHGEWFTRARSL